MDRRRFLLTSLLGAAPTQLVAPPAGEMTAQLRALVERVPPGRAVLADQLSE
jgi:hypothetical protein